MVFDWKEQGMLKFHLELPGLVLNVEAPLPLIAWLAFSVSWMMYGRKANQSKGEGDFVITKCTHLSVRYGCGDMGKSCEAIERVGGLLARAGERK